MGSSDKEYSEFERSGYRTGHGDLKEEGQAIIDISIREQRECGIIAPDYRDYADIVEMANSLIIRTDSEGIITFINNFALSTLGFRREDVTGKQIVGLLIPEVESTGRDMKVLEEKILRAPSEYTSFENENLCSDGSRKWVYWKNRIIKDNRGNFCGILGVGQDITRRKQAEEELRRSNAILEKAVEERTKELMDAQKKLDRSKRLTDLSRLATTMAHELRRPIAALRLSHYNIRKKRKNPAIDKHLDHCDQKCLEAEEIIQQFLHSASLKDSRKIVTELRVLLVNSIEYIERLHAPDNIRIIRALEPLEGIQVTVDPAQIEEVAYNILKNACEAIAPDSGIITVEGSCNESTVSFKVIDTNGGIPESELENITEPYYTTKHRSFGLGLTLSLHIIRQHGGGLDIESTLGKGTTVIVSLPYR